MLAKSKPLCLQELSMAGAYYCVFVRFVNRNSLFLVGVSILTSGWKSGLVPDGAPKQ
jgi:hypothetical protein